MLVGCIRAMEREVVRNASHHTADIVSGGIETRRGGHSPYMPMIDIFMLAFKGTSWTGGIGLQSKTRTNRNRVRGKQERNRHDAMQCSIGSYTALMSCILARAIAPDTRQ